MYKKGDWLFHEFDLFEALEDSKGESMFDIHNGSVETCAVESQCVPLTIRNKNISESFASIYSKIRELHNNGLNYPDIHWYFTKKWLQACSEKDDENIQLIYKGLYKFVESVQESVQNAVVNGVKIFRQ